MFRAPLNSFFLYDLSWIAIFRSKLRFFWRLKFECEVYIFLKNHGKWSNNFCSGGAKLMLHIPQWFKIQPFLNIFQYLRTLHTVWSLVRRRVTALDFWVKLVVESCTIWFWFKFHKEINNLPWKNGEYHMFQFSREITQVNKHNRGR